MTRSSKLNKPPVHLLNRKLIACVIGFLLFSSALAQPTADFSVDTTKGCAPVTIQFTDLSNGVNLRYLWDFGNGNVSTLQNPKAIYYQPGRYDISLTVTDQNGKQSSKAFTQYIEVFKNPIADFVGQPLSGCVPLNSTFRSTSTPGDGKITSFIWDFGDGNTQKDSIGRHAYRSPGTFNVSLAIVDENQCSDKKLRAAYVEALPSPIPKISADKQFYCTPPLDVQFQNNSSGLHSSDQFTWEFGDGNSSSSKDPKHTYSSRGGFDVILSITKANGCVASDTFRDFIQIGDFKPDFYTNTPKACAPARIKFLNTTKPTVKGVTWIWDFGDGKSSSDPAPYHTYQSAGTYTVKLRAIVDANCEAEITRTAYIEIQSAPEAGFTMTDSMSCKAPASTLLTNTSKNASEVEWLVNRESFGNRQNFSPFFTEFGPQQIELVASNFLGCTDTFMAFFNMKKPVVKAQAPDKEGCAPFPVNFTRTYESSDDPKAFFWTFENGSRNRNDDESVKHTFQNEGTYNVIVEMITEKGCKASDTVVVLVGLKTNPRIGLGGKTMCNGELDSFVNATDSKGVNVDRWEWILRSDKDTIPFSEEEEGILKSKHAPGTYDILLVSENNGCTDTFVAEDRVTILAPLAKFAYQTVEGCNTDTFLRINASIDYDSFSWNIYYPTGGLRESRGKDTLILNRDYKNHLVILEAFNFKTGCMDTARTVVRFPEVTTRAAISRSGGLCAPSVLEFKANSDAFHTYTWYTNTDTLYGANQLISFPKPGDGWIELKIKNVFNGCRDSIKNNFTVTGPEVSGELIGTAGCAPLDIKLRCNSDPKDFTELYWLIDTLKIPITSAGTIDHTLLKPGPNDGEYEIKLIGKDENSCAGYEVFPITVLGPKRADVKIRRIKSCHGRQFIFEAVAPDNNLNDLDITWDFGDGTTSDEDIHNKTYDTEGVYNLQLKMTDSKGCVSQVDKVIDIKKERLLAKFTADSLESNCPPLFVQFKDLSHTAPGRIITKWLWDFGDGSTSVERNPSKLYLFPGHFTVKLYVEDENKCADSVVVKDFVLVSGPSGTFNFDKKEGCVPLDVSFTASQKDAIKYEFDMGDGTVYRDKLNFTHTYKVPGRFIPVLVLTDTFGCTYTHPPIDTIFVYDHPKPTFTKVGVCYNKPIQFFAHNPDEDGEIEKYEWEFVQGSKKQSSTDQEPIITFNGDEKPFVRLTTTNSVGCSGDVEGYADLSFLKADFTAVDKYNCVGNIIQVKSSTLSDTAIESYHWIIGHQHFDTSEVTFSADSLGPQPITLMVTNLKGCADTLNSEKLVIGDTLPPLQAEIFRVTVNDDETIQIDLKPSYAEDFGSYELYKDVGGVFTHLHTENDRTATTIINTGNNALHKVYCFRAELRNACGVLSDSTTSIPHCTVEVGAAGEENRAVLNWNKYSGWSEVQQYEVLREELDNPGSFVSLGFTHADSTTYIDSNIVCRVEHTYKIRAIENLGNLQESFSDTCKARPIWTVKPDPNELVRASVVDDKYVIIEWDSVYTPRIPIKSYVLQRSDDGEHYNFTWDFDAQTFDFEDMEVLVDDQSYFYRTYAIDQCDDTSDFLNYGKTILLKADTSADQRPLLTWSTYQGWDAGVDYYEVEIKNPDGSFSFIGMTDSNDTMLVDEVTNLNQRPDYCYRIVGYRNNVPGKPQVVSISNEDCSPVYSRLFFPNAFTPNTDDLNEGFGTPGIYIVQYHMTIYSRWGEKIFETYNMDEKWDGTYNGEPCPMGAYAVIVESIGVDKIKRVHHGTVTLLR